MLTFMLPVIGIIFALVGLIPANWFIILIVLPVIGLTIDIVVSAMLK